MASVGPQGLWVQKATSLLRTMAGLGLKVPTVVWSKEQAARCGHVSSGDLRDKQPLPVGVHPSSDTPHSYPHEHVRTPHSPPVHETRGFEATRVSKRCSLLSDFSA